MRHRALPPARNRSRLVVGSPPRLRGRIHLQAAGSGGDRFTPTPVGTIGRRAAAGGDPAVHPHARGDDLPTPTSYCPATGSPPRPWGRPVVLAVRVFRQRFTPTPVGTTIWRVARGTRSTVHPHARGDDVWHSRKTANGDGSPPRPWGRRTARRSGDPRLSVHPHVRGDDSLKERKASRPVGSPPRPWGRLLGVSPIARLRRFTPTPVGTTLALTGYEGRFSGSPPRPWGRLGVGCARVGQRRFTPTPVGTTRISVSPPPSASVHPHARGDDWSPSNTGPWMYGSPPRPWGRPYQGGGFRASVRFTPTPVGTTTPAPNGASASSVHPHARGTTGRRASRPPRPAVHPHARGDDLGTTKSLSPIPGSPPRPWGRRSVARQRGAGRRFTPTPVGTIAPRR